MTVPTVTPSERSFSPETVCVWMSGLYIARWFNPAVPATEAEVIALALNSGVPNWQTDGVANYSKLAVGMFKRYGLTSLHLEGAAAAQAATLAAAAKGVCGVALAGDQYNLTPHWQNGHVGHSIAAFYESGTTGVQIDPLAPLGYAGDEFPPTELAKFTTAALVFTKEEVVVIVSVEKFNPPRPWQLVAPATVIGYKIDVAAGITAPLHTEAFAGSTSFLADQSMQVGANIPYLHAIDGPFAGMWVAQDAHVQLQPATPSGFTQADLDRARAGGIKDASAAAGAVK